MDNNTLQQLEYVFGYRVNYSVNPDNSIDIDGSLYITNETVIPAPIRIVTGSFQISAMIHRLNKTMIAPSTFKNYPKYVGGSFTANHLNISSLEGSPIEVGGDYNVSNCYFGNLVSLKGSPREVGGTFTVINNGIVSLDGGPQIVGENYICSHNNIEELNIPSVRVGGDLDVRNNPLKHITSLKDQSFSINGIIRTDCPWLLDINLDMFKQVSQLPHFGDTSRHEAY